MENVMSEQMKLIGEAITNKNNEAKNKAQEKLKIAKLVKAKLIATNNSNTYILTREKEIKALIEMVEQRKQSIREYKKGKREDLAIIEQQEINFIMEEVPEVKNYYDTLPTEEDIEKYTKEIIDNYILEKGTTYQITMKDMGYVIKEVKNKYENADGNIVRKILQTYMR